jgi:ribosomal protein S18 acetylase RimI-like enzyme
MRATYRIDPLNASDITTVAQLHEKAFPDFFLSSLGAGFLSEFYRGFLGDPSAVSLVARDADDKIRGAAVGTLEPEGFFGRLVRRRLLAFALVSARATVHTPQVAPRLLRALRYRGDAPSDTAGALLSSICVDPSSRGSGLGSALLTQWTREVGARGGHHAYLTTDATHNQSTNRFYQSAGWDLESQFVTREGRPMNRYSRAVRHTASMN